MDPKKCINKSLKTYKDLAERYGETLASSIIRKINRSSETKPDEFYIPSISEAKKLIKESKLQVVEKFDNVIKINPFMKERAILDYLQGIVRKKDNTVFVVKGYEAGMLDTEIVEKEIFQQNLKIVEDLKAKYPDIFEISPTPKRNVVVVKITPRIQKPPTYSQGVISFPPSKLSVAHLEEVKKNIIENLPEEVANTIEVLREVPLDIIGTPGLQLSMQSILEKTDITDPMLIAWLGYNKDLVKVTSVKSTNQLESIIQNSYNQRIKNAKPFLKGDAKVQFDNWVTSLEKYPLAFKDLLLKYAIKNLIDPKRTNKFVIALSPVALNGAFTEVSNQPHKVQQVGKIYNAHLLRTTSDATEHEPSASGKGYWVHVPRTQSNKLQEKLLFLETQLQRTPKMGNEEKGELYYSSDIGGGWFFNNKRINIITAQEFLQKTNPDKKVEIYDLISGEKWDGKESIPYYNELRIDGKKYTGYLKGVNVDFKEPNVPNKKYQELQEEIKKLQEEIKFLPPDQAQFKANVELLKKLSPQTWCTASSMASHYVENYDNYLLIVDGRTVAGIEAYPPSKIYVETPVVTSITKEEYEKAIEESYKRTNDIIGEYTEGTEEFTEDGKIYYVDVSDNIRYKREGDQYTKTEHKQEEVVRRQVKEVTSIANNGIAPIDHLDDILAFFEKHNLDTNNESLKNAIRAKENGKTDEDLFEIYTEPEDFYDYYEQEYEQEYEPDWEDYRERGIMMEAEANERDQASDIQEPEKAIEFLRNAQFNIFDYMSVEMRSNQQVAEAAIEKDAHNITFVPEDLPFYKELAHKAVTKRPSAFAYISDEAKAEQRNIDLHERHLEEIRNIPALDDLPFSKTKDSQIQGYYNPRTDKVVVISSNIETNEAARIGIHEVAHRGMLRMARDLGGVNQLYDVLSSAKKQLMEKLPLLLERTGHKTLEDLMVDYGFNKDSKAGELKLLMELAARWSETLVDKPKPSWWNRLLQNIGQWIKQFVGIDLTESQVDQLVGGFVQYGTTKEKLTFDESLQFSKTAQPIKPGVEELFESNKTLANAVYEALGFKKSNEIKSIEDKINTLGRKWLLDNFKEKSEIATFLKNTNPEKFKTFGEEVIYDMPLDEIVYYLSLTAQEFQGGVGKVFTFNSIEDIYNSNNRRSNYDEAIKVRNYFEKNFGISSKLIDGFNSEKKLQLEKALEEAKNSLLNTYGVRISDKVVNGKYRLLLRRDPVTVYDEFDTKEEAEKAESLVNKKVIDQRIKNTPAYKAIQDAEEVTPQQKQQALQLYSQYLDSITNEPIVYKGLRDKSTKVHDTPNHSYFTPDKNIADKWYKDEKGVKTFVIPKVESVEFRSDSSQGVSKFRKDEENFINNAQQPLIKLDTYDIGFRQIQYVLNKNIAPLELGTEKDIKEFKQFIEKSDLSKTAETFEKPEKVIKFTSFEDIEKLKKGKPC